MSNANLRAAQRLAAFCAVVFGSFAWAGESQQFSPDGRLLTPDDYRTWITVGTGLNMAYGPARAHTNGRSVFTNVFVGPEAYRTFVQTGAWPEHTVFILEIRSANVVNKTDGGGNGYFQGDILAIEAEVKDTKRFAGGWAFFDLGAKETSGAQIPTSADCYSCHATNAAVENTFVQFYPVLRDVARQKGTFKNVPEKF